MRYFKAVFSASESTRVVSTRLEIECRRYMPAGMRWSVFVYPGWPGDKPLKCKTGTSKETMKRFISEFMTHNNVINNHGENEHV